MPERATHVLPFGDAAVLVAIDGDELPERARRAAAVARTLGPALRASEGWAAPIAGVGGVLVTFDPLILDAAAAAQRVRTLIGGAASPASPAAGPVIDIPVRYGGQDGPDLDGVAASVGLDAAQLVRLHAGREYEALVLGFLPGFAYLGPLPSPLSRVGRRATPRTRVAAGSVALAGGMTAVYPTESAGGWHVIGRTDVPMWRPDAQRPNRLAVGDRVRFVPAGRRP